MMLPSFSPSQLLSNSCLSVLAALLAVPLCSVFSGESVYLKRILSCIQLLISVLSVRVRASARLLPVFKQTDLSVLQGSA